MSETVTTTFVSDSRQAEAAYERLTKRVVDLEMQLARAKVQSQQAGKANDEAFGARTADTLGRTVAQYVSLGAALSVVKTMLSDIRQERAAAGDLIPGMAATSGLLAQVAKSESDLKKLEELRDRLFAAGATPTREMAGELAFTMRSAGMEGDEGLISRLGASRVFTDMVNTTRAIVQLRSAFGDEMTGSLQQEIAQAVVAGEISALGTPEQMLQQAAQAGGFAKALGMKRPDVLAAETIVGDVYGIEEGGTAVMNLLRQLGDKDNIQKFEGLSLPEAVQKLMGMGRGQVQEVLPEIRALKAFDALAARYDKFVEVYGAISGAGTEATEAMITRAMGSPAVRADLAARRSSGELETLPEVERRGELEKLTNAIEGDIEKQLTAQGVPAWSRWISRQSRNLDAMFNSQEEWIRHYGVYADEDTRGDIGKAGIRLNEYDLLQNEAYRRRKARGAGMGADLLYMMDEIMQATLPDSWFNPLFTVVEGEVQRDMRKQRGWSIAELGMPGPAGIIERETLRRLDAILDELKRGNQAKTNNPQAHVE